MNSTTSLLLLIDAALLITIGLVLLSEHRVYEARVQTCVAQCQHDYTKATQRPVPGTYDTCIAGCNAQD